MSETTTIDDVRAAAIVNYADSIMEKLVADAEEKRPQQLLALILDHPNYLENQRIEYLSHAQAKVKRWERAAGIVNDLYIGAFEPNNPYTRALFTAIFGVELPETRGGMVCAIRSHIGANLFHQLAADRAATLQQAIQAGRQAEIDAKAAVHAAQVENIKDAIKEGRPVSGGSVLTVARDLGFEVHPRTASSLKKKLRSIHDIDGNLHFTVEMGEASNNARLLFLSVLAKLRGGA